MDPVYNRRAALALFSVPLWSQSRTNPPAGGKMPHPVVRFEIGCRDRAKTERFFSELFGWEIQQNGPAGTIEAPGPHGIPGHITSLNHEPYHYAMFYVEVEDVKSSLDKAVSLGGKILVPPVKIPTGRFAWFADPDGNTIGLLEQKA